jgi:hypothetical protein
LTGTFSKWDATLHVLPGCGEAYKNAYGWEKFANIAEDATTDIGIQPTIISNKENVYYDLRGNQLTHPEKGLYIVNSKKIIVK